MSQECEPFETNCQMLEVLGESGIFVQAPPAWSVLVDEFGSGIRSSECVNKGTKKKKKKVIPLLKLYALGVKSSVFQWKLARMDCRESLFSVCRIAFKGRSTTSMVVM